MHHHRTWPGNRPAAHWITIKSYRKGGASGEEEYIHTSINCHRRVAHITRDEFSMEQTIDCLLQSRKIRFTGMAHEQSTTASPDRIYLRRRLEPAWSHGSLRLRDRQGRVIASPSLARGRYAGLHSCPAYVATPGLRPSERKKGRVEACSFPLFRKTRGLFFFSRCTDGKLPLAKSAQNNIRGPKLSTEQRPSTDGGPRGIKSQSDG